MKIYETEAAILVEQNRDLEIRNISLPKKLDYGQVLVEVHFSGICGSQIGEITGVKGPDKYLPHLLGHEGSGKVLEVGPNVKTVSIGDRVVMHWRKGEGINSETPKYKMKNKIINAGFVTTFNKHAIVSENRITKINSNICLKKAALFGCAITTGLGVICNDARAKIGQSIIIFGAGGIGLNMIQGAKLSGLYPIIAVDLYEHKLKIARKFGANFTINTSKEDIVSEVSKIIGPNNGADIVIDNTGNVDVIRICYELTNKRGRTVLVGVPRIGQKVILNTLPLHFDKSIVGSEGGQCKPERDIPNYIKLFKNSILDLEGMITEEYKLNEINLAINRMKENLVSGRIIISMKD